MALIIEDDDVERLALLKRAFAEQRDAITFKAYPGETDSPEWHVYARAPSVADTQIFACVLASPATMQAMAKRHPDAPAMPDYCWFQAIKSDAPDDVVTGICVWIKKVFPDVMRLPQAQDVTFWSEADDEAP